LEFLDILLNLSILVLEASKFGLSLLLSIHGIELLLKFPLESIPSGDRVGSLLDVVTLTTPQIKGNFFREEGSVAYLLGFILDAYRSKVGFKSPKDVLISLAFFAPL